MDITLIPVGDVVTFIQMEGQPVPTTEVDIYKMGEVLIRDLKPGSEAPEQIVYFIMAEKVLDQGKDIQMYKASDIYMDKVDLNQLALDLGLNEINKDTIIGVLSYIGKLENDIDLYESVPTPILVNMLSSVDINSIESLCMASEAVNEKCQDPEFWGSLIILRGYEGDINALSIEEMKVIYSYMTSSKRGWPLGTGYHSDNQFNLDPTQVGYGPLKSPYLIPDVGECINVSVGRVHNVFINISGEAILYGRNDVGQLGTDDPNDESNRLKPTNGSIFVMAAASHDHTLLLMSNGNVIYFGDIDLVDIDTGNVKKIAAPMIIPGINNISNIVSNHGIITFTTKEGYLYIMGNPTKNSNVLIHLDMSYGYKYSGRIRTPLLVPGMDNIVKAVYSQHLSLYGLRSDGTVLVLTKTGIQVMNNVYSVIDISAGWRHVLMLRNDGKVYVCGYNDYGQLGINEDGLLNYPRYNLRAGNLEAYTKDEVAEEAILNPFLTDIMAIAAGERHSLFLRRNRTVLGSGSINEGELGLGKVPDLSRIPFKNRTNDIKQIDYPIVIPNLENITNVFAGAGNSVFLTSDPDKYI